MIIFSQLWRFIPNIHILERNKISRMLYADFWSSFFSVDLSSWKICPINSDHFSLPKPRILSV